MVSLGSCDRASSTHNPHATVSARVGFDTIDNAPESKQRRSTLYAKGYTSSLCVKCLTQGRWYRL